MQVNLIFPHRLFGLPKPSCIDMSDYDADGVISTPEFVPESFSRVARLHFPVRVRWSQEELSVR